jgi:hypothetical protein
LGIETATFQLAAQCLNQLRHHMPQHGTVGTQTTTLQVEDTLTNKCPIGLCFCELLCSAGWFVTNILGWYISLVFKDIMTLHDQTNLLS